ncbi:hypothetical protein GGX14DRAFT_672129 [Mycena pura]|uniref:Uncharacterized protein n=1 Tax=Mycena pura TaxID=153505 RepID=A0AAD6V437_9AGAR|nr:hypothetical protein GGX14DRAFT_672129 [Mycena pura]
MRSSFAEQNSVELAPRARSRSGWKQKRQTTPSDIWLPGTLPAVGLGLASVWGVFSRGKLEVSGYIQDKPPSPTRIAWNRIGPDRRADAPEVRPRNRRRTALRRSASGCMSSGDSTRVSVSGQGAREERKRRRSEEIRLFAFPLHRSLRPVKQPKTSEWLHQFG